VVWPPRKFLIPCSVGGPQLALRGGRVSDRAKSRLMIGKPFVLLVRQPTRNIPGTMDSG